MAVADIGDHVRPRSVGLLQSELHGSESGKPERKGALKTMDENGWYGICAKTNMNRGEIIYELR